MIKTGNTEGHTRWAYMHPSLWNHNLVTSALDLIEEAYSAPIDSLAAFKGMLLGSVRKGREGKRYM